MDNMTNLYLDLLKNTLTNKIYSRYEYIDLTRSDGRIRKYLGALFSFQMRVVSTLFPKHKSYLSGRPLISKECHWPDRENGLDWPAYAYTMVGRKRLDNLQMSLDIITKENVPGDVVETGVWRGGACIFIAGYLKAHGEKRTVWVMDSFEGLPKPKLEEDRGDIHHTFSQLAVSVDNVKENFAAFNLLDDNVKFVKGFFTDTAPTLPAKQIALLRLDGDMYESTIVVLDALYPKLSDGGVLIVDDYFLPNCRRAIDDYRRKHGISDTIVEIDGSSAYWRKSVKKPSERSGGSEYQTTKEHR